MSANAALPQPDELYEIVHAACRDKAGLPTKRMIILGMLAGAYIGLGGLFATIALAGADALPFGAAQVLAGFVFSLGLALVLVAGAELFTGNTLMIGPVLSRQIPAPRAVKALSVVYLANFAGAAVLSVVVALAGLHEAGEGAVGRAALDMAGTKTAKSFMTATASGILANFLVCLAVWMAYAGQTTTQKIFGLLLPVAAFVAAGLEHSIANMYLLSYALIVQSSVGESSVVSLGGMASNLCAATIGNIVGGALLALAYQAAYGKAAKP